VAALLVRAGPLAAEVLTTEVTVERLVPGAGAGAANGEVPGLRVVADDAAVLCLLEAEVLARTRQLDADDAPDIINYRHTYPWDPLPTIVGLVGEVPVMDSGRWAAVCSSGSRLGLGAVLLDGESPSGVRIGLDANHVVVEASPEEVVRRLVGIRCFVLRPDEAADVFATLTEVERRPSSDEEPDETTETPTDATVEEEPWPVAVLLVPEETAMSGEASGPPLVEVASEVPPPIAVRLFGPYEIVVDGATVASGLRGVARELLAWYLLRPEGASIGAAVDACWPNTDPVEVSTKFWRAASDLRKRIGRVARPSTQLLVQVGDAYRLDPQAIDCDLWQFQAALGDAAGASDDKSTRDALRRVVACYRGEFVENADYQWVEPVRQDLHRRALDAYLRLAELEEQLNEPDAAAGVLGRAIELDRYAEEPYRRLMTLQGGSDRSDAVSATWRLLERRLAEIDVDPEPATVRLYRSLSELPTTLESHSGPLRLTS
jgi:DNA-binding SARP family transcriptional activator